MSQLAPRASELLSAVCPQAYIARRKIQIIYYRENFNSSAIRLELNARVDGTLNIIHRNVMIVVLVVY